MNRTYDVDEWKIIESGFNPGRQRASESVFSIGNGHMGQRANFEEQYSGDSLQGSYIAGIYYPDKTKVGWWKIGYPEYFAKIVNSVNWIGIDIEIEGEALDLDTCKVEDFKRVLNMKEGYLQRSFTATLPGGNKVAVRARRFVSMKRREAGVVEYHLEPLNFDGTIRWRPYLNGDVQNEDANYDEKFWEEVDQGRIDQGGFVHTRTLKTEFEVCAGMRCALHRNDEPMEAESVNSEVTPMYAERTYEVEAAQNQIITLHKYAVVASSLNHERKRLQSHVESALQELAGAGFEQLLQEQSAAWEAIWNNCDVQIAGDPAAQQGIRFNIFQLYQTYTGDDPRLNIGPKGFTGEKYGGVTYWDTEAYCLPFYLSTAGQEVARNLLLYRYRHLEKAFGNAQKLGFGDGAALYPMVTINGEECHNEWEITFEEIHRNGAIAYAIFNYIRHTGDVSYLWEAGLEVLIGISRFWKQRFQYSEHRGQYVMLGVTGPNEYENNVHNNWYTSYIACWCMRYTAQAIERAKEEAGERWSDIRTETSFLDEEVEEWQNIIDNVYLPEDPDRGIVLQQDGFLDKDLRPADSLDPAERPINQHWSWDRILRSCFIKQGDVVQGLYFFEHEFEEATIRRNYDFYESLTVHESSLSPCIHSILASKLDYPEKAYELYLRTARLDLDDYNKEVHQGLHITSMAGTWMTIVEGFAGKRIRDGKVHFSPSLPARWEGYAFKMRHRGRVLKLQVTPDQLTVRCVEGEALELFLFDRKYTVNPSEPLQIEAKPRPHHT